MSNTGKVYLIPSFLHEDGMDALPAYIKDAVTDCSVFFVENERSARRYLKKIWKEMVIDDYQWVVIHNAEEKVKDQFRSILNQGKNIAIISEAGCPGIADPGQILIEVAQQINATVKPLVGPSSILLALMASGMNGQQFQFVGYLPIAENDRVKKLKELEMESRKKSCTQIFIETPYRNNQMIQTILKTCEPATQLCIAMDITGDTEWIKTKSIAAWKTDIPDIHKRTAIFLILAR
jgi:16S rRNA (cytidine1402-2'-O)-methyltransferase